MRDAGQHACYHALQDSEPIFKQGNAQHDSFHAHATAATKDIIRPGLLISLAPTHCRCTCGQTETVQKSITTVKHHIRCVWQPNLMSIASCIPEILKGV